MAYDEAKAIAALHTADTSGDTEGAQHIADYIKSNRAEQSTPDVSTPKSIAEKVFGEGVRPNATFEERVGRVGKAGLETAKVMGAVGGITGLAVGGPAAPITGVIGTLTGAATGAVMGMGGEIIEQGVQAMGYSRGPQVTAGMLLGGSIPTLLEKAAKSVLGKVIPGIMGKTGEAMTPSVSESAAIATGKEAIVGKPYIGPTEKTVNTVKMQQKLSQEASNNGIKVLSKDELKAMGTDIGGREARVSDSVKQHFFGEMDSMSAQGLNPVKTVVTPTKGIPSATGKTNTAGQTTTSVLDADMEKHLVDFGKATKNELGIIKTVFKNQTSPNPALRKAANEDLLNLIQRGGFASKSGGNVVIEQKLSNTARDALRESYGDFIKKTQGTETYKTLVNSWHSEKIAEAQDAIPQIIKSGFSTSEKLGPQRMRKFDSVLKNIGEEPQAKKEFATALNQHLSDLNISRDTGKPLQKAVSVDKMISEIERLRDPIVRAGIMTEGQLDSLVASVQKIPSKIDSAKRWQMARTIATRALAVAGTQASTNKDNK